MSDFFSVYGAAPAQGPVAPTAPTRFTEIEPQAPYERNFLERIFAPFEAPQQGLFALTQNVARDGFQARDLLDSLGHAARYFNPWSDEKPIDADEIRRTFLGEDADQTGWARFGSNLAISLLYDPLIFTGLTKGLATMGRTGAMTGRAVNALLNPAEALIDATKFAAKDVIGAGIHRLGREVMGELKWDFHSTRAAQYLVNRYAGVPEELVRKVGRFEQDVARWRTDAFSVLKKAEKLRGPEAQRLLAEAMENEAFYLNHMGRTLTKKQQTRLALFETKLESAGISMDLFAPIYNRMRTLDDQIGEGLLRHGVIDAKSFKEYQGTHLRRMYQAFEKPLDYVDRIEALMVKSPELAKDVTRVSKSALRKSLVSLGDEAAGAGGFRAVRPTDRAGRAAFRQTVDASPYFSSANRNAFDADRFSEDLVGWLDKNPKTTAAEAFEHVQQNMLGGVQMSDKFWANIGNHLTGAQYTRPGLETYRNRLLDLANGHSTTWRSIQERIEIVSKRENLPEEIREALGEVLTVGPRVAGQAADAGRLLETRKFLDDLAGVRRLDPEVGGKVAEAKRLLLRGDRVPDTLMADIERGIGRKLRKEEIASLEIGGILSKDGSDLASLNKTAKHKHQIPKDPTYGELAGMYVETGTYLMLRRLEGVGDVANPTTGIAHALLEGIRTATGHFKTMKVIMDPTAQFRNFLGNMVLMDMQGTNPLHVDKLIKAGREIQQFAQKGEMGQYMRLAEEAGLSLFQHTFSRQELVQFGERIGAEAVDRKTWKGFFQGMFGALNSIYEVPARIGSKAFEFSEQMFKLDVFIDQYDKLARAVARSGRTLDDAMRIDLARQAGALAEQALFNYADVPYLVDFARKYGVVPFATFPFKAVPYVAETLHKHPTRILKYERGVEEWNESSPWQPAGGPEEVAREIQGLPEHVRDALVLQVPGKDASGRQLYIDLAYFLPWYVIQDLKQQGSDPIAAFLGVGGQAAGTPGTEGLRGGILTPPAMALIDALRRNEDSLGRPVVKPGMSGREALLQWGKFFVEFWMPPSAPGGSRTDSIGRAMQAWARTDPDAVDWAEALGRGLRLGANQDSVLPASGDMPQSQAQVAGNPILGGLLGALTGGTVASDPEQQRRNTVASYRGESTDLARQIATIRNNQSLTIAEKRERILRIQARMQELREDTRTQLARF